MKKLLLFLCVLAGMNGFSQISVRTQTTPTQLTAGNGTVVVRSGTVAVSGTVTALTAAQSDSLKQIPFQMHRFFQDGSGNTAITRLNNIYTSVYNTETQCNYISDSISSQNALFMAQAQTAELSFTVNSTNTGTAVANNQALGVGAYSVTIPSGRWYIESIHCIFKLQSATMQQKMFVMQGSSNCAAVAEEAVYNLSSANALEVSQVYVSNTTNYIPMIWNGSTGAVSHFNSFNQPSVFSEKHVYTAGTLKLFLAYNASVTPANTNSYYFRIYLRRVS